MPARLKEATDKPHRTTLNLTANAHRLAERRARTERISFGDAVSAFIEEGGDATKRPRARLEMRDGLPTFVTPPGSPAITSELVKEVLENEW